MCDDFDHSADDMTDEEANRLAVIVRDRKDGWESAWERLVEPVMDRVWRRLQQVAGDLPGGPGALDDVYGIILLEYHEKAVEGRLLHRWKPENIPVLWYLGGKLLKRVARRLAARDVHRGPDVDWVGDQPLSIWEFEDRLDEEEAVDASADNGGSDRGVIDGARLHFLDLGEQGVTNSFCMAGLQLWPRVDWSAAPAPKVRNELTMYVGDAAGLKRLPVLHEAMRKALEAKIEAKIDESYNDGRGVTPLRKRKIEQRLLKLRWECEWRPLAAVDLVELTGKSRNTCDQDRSRYKRDLPRVIDEYTDLVGEVVR